MEPFRLVSTAIHKIIIGINSARRKCLNCESGATHFTFEAGDVKHDSVNRSDHLLRINGLPAGFAGTRIRQQHRKWSPLHDCCDAV